MSNEYNSNIHTYVTVKVPHCVKPLHYGTDILDMDGPLFGPHAIILAVPQRDRSRDRVWIMACHDFLGLYEEIRQVKDDGHGFSMEGDCVLSVPASWCKFYTEEEAGQITRGIQADEDLLRYARG